MLTIVIRCNLYTKKIHQSGGFHFSRFYQFFNFSNSSIFPKIRFLKVSLTVQDKLHPKYISKDGKQPRIGTFKKIDKKIKNTLLGSPNETTIQETTKLKQISVFQNTLH